MTLFGTRSLRSLFTHPGFAEGVRAIAGPALGTVALGLVTGVAMARSGLPMGAVVAMSLLVFASGQKPELAVARFDLARADFSNYHVGSAGPSLTTVA